MELLIRNVAEVVDTPKYKRPEIKIMSESDIHLFLDYAKDTPYYALFYTALFTGMRRAELFALRWSDVDLDMCQLYVNRSMQYLDKENGERKITFKEPKTAKSRRLIALSPSTAMILNEHREEINALRVSLDYPETSMDDLVFYHYDGTQFLPHTITHNWIKITRKSGLNGIRLHDARHTHASLLLKQGIHPKIVQERLGNSSIQLTEINIGRQTDPALPL